MEPATVQKEESWKLIKIVDTAQRTALRIFVIIIRRVVCPFVFSTV